MDDKTHKEKLEQELRFLKESFEAEVISKEEYEKGKERLEKKLNEIEKIAKDGDEEAKEEQKMGQIIEKKEDVNKDIKDGEKIRLKVIQEIEQEAIKEDVHEKPAEVDGQKRQSKFFKYAVVFIVLTLVIFFSYSLLKNDKEFQEKKEEVMPANIAKTNVIILNGRKNCFNCDTQRVTSILEQWFGAINAKEMDYNTREGNDTAEKFNARLLPMYILDESITNSSSFEQFKQVFVKKDNYYILSEDAAGSTFYFRRDNIPNKLDLFFVDGDNASKKSERNMREFLEVFKDVKFEKHLSSENLAKELGIKNFPTFLINNRIKFSGVHTAETIKENFCKMNKLEACSKILSKSLI